MVQSLVYMLRDKELVNEYIATCKVCVDGKRLAPTYSPGLGRTTALPHPRLKHWAVDLVAYPLGVGGYNYILTCMCLATGWLEVFPLRKATSAAICRVLEFEVVPRYGEGLTLICDNGSQFNSRLFRSAIRDSDCFIYFGTPYQPNSLPVERCHRLLNSLVRMELLGRSWPKEKWPKVLPSALLNLRCSPDKTGFPPHYRVFGKFPMSRASIWFETDLDDNQLPESESPRDMTDPRSAEVKNPPEIKREDEKEVEFTWSNPPLSRTLHKVMLGNTPCLAQTICPVEVEEAAEAAQQKKDELRERTHRYHAGRIRGRPFVPVKNELVDWLSPFDPDSADSKKLRNLWRGPFLVVDVPPHQFFAHIRNIDLDTGQFVGPIRRASTSQLRPTLWLAFLQRPKHGFKPPWHVAST